LTLPSRALLSIVLATVISLGALVASSGSESEIVIRGARSGTHLRLVVHGSRLIVEGRLAGRRQAGCTTKGRRAAVCPLAHVGGVTVETGPSSDKVKVLSSLPTSLTVYLGGGSDKLIGDAEPDICYPQGTRRNRCVGGPGDDVCIAGPVNTDCVGGPGNDYCKTSSGSDGCWGGPGRDTCLMGGGEDGCHGEGGDDLLYGGPGADRLYGGPGRDYCDGGPGRGRSAGCEAGPDR
jgi:hypothetical protein